MTDDPENLRKFLERRPCDGPDGTVDGEGDKSDIGGRATQRSTYLRDAVARALEKIGHEVE